MALINLRSSLAWYDQKPGFAPNAAANESDYKGNVNDSTYFTVPQGYDNQGFATYFTPRVSANAFAIDDASHSFRGTASRRAQQGAGSKFPIGPKGQQHDFDIPRLGFHRKNKYGDLYSSLTTFGLADTYTKDSPIDDVYNIVKVRDVSYDPFGYASPPYILRGIQRDNNRYPQRWGTGNQIADTVSLALGVPRGGALAFGERVGNDVARLAKMMIRPMGLGWIAKQALLHLMNPNTEGVTGLIQRPNNHKVSNPLNTLLAAGVSGLGIHPRKHGLLPIGGLGRYEDVHKRRNVLEPLTPIKVGGFNRLSRLTDELYRYYNFPYAPNWFTITGATGPDTVGGIGVTNFSTDSAQGNLDQLLKYPGKDGKGSLSIVDGLGLLPAKINAVTPRFISRDFISRYSDFVVLSPLVMAWDTGKLSYYQDTIGAFKFTRKLPKHSTLVTGPTMPKNTIVSTGTRPDLNNDEWKIFIPRLTTAQRSYSGIRTSEANPVNLVPYTLSELMNYTDLYRSYLNPYNWANADGGGAFDSAGQSQLEARYYMREDLDNIGLHGIPKSELTDRPGNRFTLSSVQRPTKVDISGRGNHTIQDKPVADLAKNYKNIVPYRGIIRTNETPYGNPGKLGYGNGSDNTGASLNTGEKSNLVTNQEFIRNAGLDIGNDQIGKRLSDPKETTGITRGTNHEGGVPIDIRSYTAMTYPHMMMISKNRSLSKSGRSRPALLEFKRENDGKNDPTWDKTSSPMSTYVNQANGWLNGGADTDPNFWTKETSATRTRPISSGPNMDLITFKIGKNRFKAYITDWSDKISQGLNKFKPAGSPIDVVAGASSFERSVSVSFLVAARSHNELRTIYKGLVNLQNLVKPNYIGSGAWAPSLTNLTIGDIYGKDGGGISVYITEMSLSIDNEYPWEIEDTEQVPMYLNVDLSFDWPNGGAINLPGQGTTPPFEEGEEQEWKIYNDDMNAEISDKAAEDEKAKQIDASN